MNIVGEGLRPFVSQQIAIRQGVYGSGFNGVKNRTLEEIEYLNSRTAFIKLVSSVNLTDKFNPASEELKAIKNKYGANKLAEAFILFNGTSNVDNIQRSGINRIGNLINNTAAYGVGGLEFGLRPMPGITSATIKTETRGSLKTGTINIKAWNRAQFEIIDILYLRLGYGVLLEWGNTIYFDNNKNLVKQQPNSIAKDFLTTGTFNTQTVLTAINDKRKDSSGNYDAIFGKVVNFSWQFGDNGSYDITLTIRSIGDVVEGLKLNILVNDKAGEITIDKPSTNSSDSTPPSEPPQPTIESYKDKHQIGRLLYEVKRCLDKYSVKQNGCLSIGNIYLNNKGELTEDIATERNFLVQTYAGNENQYYIRLGAFLNYLQEKVVPRYNNGSIPIIDFDYKTADNIIYAVSGEGTVSQVSTEPDKCVITTQIKYTDGNVYYYAPEGQPFKTELGNVTVGQVMNIYLNFRYILSVIDEQATQDSSSKKIAKTITILNSLLNGASTAIGGANRLTTYIDEEENKIKIIDENPLHGKNEVIKALRGIPNDETITKLDLYGYYNNQTTAGFVRKFGFKTEITPELSYMLSIGAQAAGSVIGQDSTALSKLNEGLEDRIKPEVVDAISGKAEATETKEDKLVELNERYKNSYADFSKALKNLGSLNNDTIPIWDPENISNYSNLQLDFIAYNEAKTAIKEKKASNHIGFIPISLNLTLDGLSGIKIYNALRVDTAYLPSNYPATMDFIITGVSNKIENNTWTTDLTTVMVPRDPSQSNSPQDQDGSQSTQNSTAISTTNSAAASTTTSSNNRAASRNTGPLTKTVTSGFPVKTTSFRAQNVAKSQIVIHYSAGAPLGDKGKQTVDFLMGRSHKKNGPPLGLSYHYIIDYNGFIENVIPDNYVAFHAGGANTNSIGISLLNYGVAYSENRATYDGTIKIGEKGVLLVNENGKPQSYRNWKYACEISLAQQKSLETLLGIIADRYPKIKYKWEGKKTFDILFPPNGYNKGKSTSYDPNIPGIYTHCSVTTYKTDCMPTPRIMEVLKRVKLNVG